MKTPAAVFTFVAAALILTGSATDVNQDGVLAFQQGRYADSLARFRTAAKHAGRNATAELLFNQALAALQSGELVTADEAAELAAVRGGENFRALRDFLFGNTAFVRTERAEAVARKPGALAEDFDLAIAHLKDAVFWWQTALERRVDWPAARRNLERALLKLRELESLREWARNNAVKKMPQPKPRPKPVPSAEGQPGTPLPAEAPEVIRLTPEQIQALMDTLETRKAEKQQIRQATQRQSAVVERDW